MGSRRRICERDSWLQMMIEPLPPYSKSWRMYLETATTLDARFRNFEGNWVWGLLRETSRAQLFPNPFAPPRQRFFVFSRRTRKRQRHRERSEAAPLAPVPPDGRRKPRKYPSGAQPAG